MKFAESIATTEGNAVFEGTVKASVQNESIAHIIHSLTEIYSNPLLAVAREYVSNAYDATVERMGANDSFGTVLDIPIEVFLPSILNPNFIVRDYGTGMDRHTLSNVFLQYGASTKRDTNSQIGGFGLGAKSALAAVSNFTVVSVKNGKKNTGIVQKGLDGVGEISFLPEMETDEPSGTTVTINLSNDDAASLSHMFKSHSLPLLLGFPHNSIKVNGRMHKESVFNDSLYTKLGDFGYVANQIWNGKELFGSDYNLQDNRSNDWTGNQKVLTVLVGPIAYRVRATDLPARFHLPLANYCMRPASKDLILTLPIGSVDMTPAREMLIYSERTCSAILNAAEQMENEISARIQTELGNCTTADEAIDFSTKAHNGWLGEKEELIWQGMPDAPVPVRDWSYFSLPTDEPWNRYVGDGRGTWMSNQDVHKLSPGRYNGFLSKKIKIVLVTGLKESEKGARVEIVVKRTNRYAPNFTKARLGLEQEHMSYPHPNGPKETKAVVLYTSGDASNFNAWLPFMADVVVPVEEFIEVSRKYHKEQTKSNQQTTKSNLPISIVYIDTNSRAVLQGRTTTMEELSKGLYARDKVIYMKADPANPDTAESKIAASFRGAKTEDDGGVSRAEIGAYMMLIERKHRAQGGIVTFFRLNAKANLDEFLKVMPHAVSFGALLKEEAESLAKDASPLRSFYQKYDSEYSWLEQDIREPWKEDNVDVQPMLDNIVNLEARSFFKKLRADIKKEGPSQIGFEPEVAYVWSPLFDKEFAKLRGEVETLHSKFGLPLAKHLPVGGITPEMVEDVIGYINVLHPVQG